MCKICTKSEYACQSSFRQDWQCLKEKLINIDRCPVIRSRKQRPEDALTKRSDHETSVSEMKGLREECWSREKKGKRHWKAKRECSRRDSCSFCHEDNQRGKTAQSSSLAPKSQTQNDGRRPLKGNASRSGPSCDYWHPPACQKKQRNRDANSAISVFSGTLRLAVSAAKSRRKEVEGVGCLEDTESPKSMSFLRKGPTSLGSDRSHRSLLRRHVVHQKIGKERSTARSSSRS